MFDEVCLSVPKHLQPPMSAALQRSGYQAKRENRPISVRVESTDKDVHLSSKATTKAAGFDLYSGENTTIAPGQQQKIFTKLKFEILSRYYAQILVHSSFASKYKATVDACTIDSDYRGLVYVLMSNHGTKPINIEKNNRFAQFMLHKVPNAIITLSTISLDTERYDGEFGSTGVKRVKSNSNSEAKVAQLLFDNIEINDEQSINDEPIYNVHLLLNPYIDAMPIKFTPSGNHGTRGLVLKQSKDLSIAKKHEGWMDFAIRLAFGGFERKKKQSKAWEEKT